MKMLRSTLMALCALISFNVWALDIDNAKSSGLVGETTTGYLAPVSSSPTPEVRALVQDINSKRKQQYIDIANKRGIPLSAVEKLAAKKAYEKTAPGHYVKNANGAWVTK